MNEKLLIAISMDAESSDIVEQLLRRHDIVNQSRLAEKVANIVTVSKEEFQAVGMGGLDRLPHVNEVDFPIVPKHVVLAQVCVNQSTLGVHSLHSLWGYV